MRHDTLMGCFASFLWHSEARSGRMWIRHKLVAYLVEQGHVDHQFALRNNRENYIEDKVLFCDAFARVFQVNVNLCGEQYFNVQSCYTIHLRHADCQFHLVVPAARPRRNMNQILYDLRLCTEGRCDVVGQFEPRGDHQMHVLRLIPRHANQIYGVHPHAQSDEVLVQVPPEQTLYVFLDGTCISSLRHGDDVHPRFIIPQHGKHVELVILMARTKSLAQQYMQMELLLL